MNLKATHPNVANTGRSTTIDFCLCTRKVLTHITYAASTPYDLEILGDHRGFLIDINISQLFEEEVMEKEHLRRKLFMSNPKAVEKYLAKVDEKFQKQYIYIREA